MKILLALICMFFPLALKRFIYSKLYGFKLHKTARIGFSLVLCERLTMGRNSKIGHMTVIKDVSEVTLGEFAIIGNLNWITGFLSNSDSQHFVGQNSRLSTLIMGDHAAITNRHYIDCTDVVFVGRFSTVAGIRTQILTHSISIQNGCQESGSVIIGDYVFVGTGSILLANTTLPNCSVLGAGSVLNKKFTIEYYLYAGTPARPLKELDKNHGYFNRMTGFVN